MNQRTKQKTNFVDQERKILFKSKGFEECKHYWVATGEHRDGYAIFRCKRCRSRMAEPVMQPKDYRNYVKNR